MNLQEFLNEVNGRESDIVCYAGEEALAAVKCNGDALQYVKDQSEAVCLAAVKQNGHALRYVKDQSEAVCLAAVKQNGRALRYVKDQSEAVCLAAVKCNGYTLQYVKDQSEAVCLAAVKQDSDALQYVDKRIFKNTEVFTETPEVCIKCFTIEDCPLIAALRSEIESLRCSGIEIEPCALFLAINKAPN